MSIYEKFLQRHPKPIENLTEMDLETEEYYNIVIENIDSKSAVIEDALVTKGNIVIMNLKLQRGKRCDIQVLRGHVNAFLSEKYGNNVVVWFQNFSGDTFIKDYDVTIMISNDSTR